METRDDGDCGSEAYNDGVVYDRGDARKRPGHLLYETRGGVERLLRHLCRRMMPCDMR